MDIVTKTRALIGEIREGIRYWFRYDGRPPFPEAGSPDPVEREQHTLERQFEISKSIPAFAGLEIVNPSTLWVSASGFEDTESGAKHEPQVIFPPNKEGGDEEQLKFAREIFDTYLKKDGVSNIIEQMFYSGARYGRFVQEIGWVRRDTLQFGERVIPEFLRDCPPQFYLKDPEGYKKGIYRKDTMYNYKNIERMPDNRFLWGTFYKYFENPYGIALMSLLDTIESRFDNNWKDWLTANKRTGVGVLYAQYGTRTGRSEASREQLLDQLKEIQSSMRSIFPDDVELKTVENAIQNDSFRDAHKAIMELYSLLITGSPTTLTEAQNGSYGREESQNTRRHSQKQKYYANIISHVLTTQLIWPAIDFNYTDVKVYPWVQIIAPEYISPIVAKDERDPKEEEENDDNRTEDRKPAEKVESKDGNA